MSIEHTVQLLPVQPAVTHSLYLRAAVGCWPHPSEGMHGQETAGRILICEDDRAFIVRRH